MKILVVEDQKRLGQFLKKGLSEHSYTVAWAQSCAEARDALCETHYDGIILDLGLPDGDGLELLREWRKTGFNEPVLILSARDTVQDRINRLIRILLAVPTIAACKQIMTWRGIPCGHAAGPRRQMTADEVIWLRTQLETWEKG